MKVEKKKKEKLQIQIVRLIMIYTEEEREDHNTEYTRKRYFSK